MQVRKGGVGENTDTKLLYDKLHEQQNTINDLRVHVAQLLAGETGKMQELLSGHFTKSQEQGFKTQNEVQQSLTQLLEKMQTSLTNGIKLLNETTAQQLQTLSRTNTERLSHIQESVEKRLDENLKRNLESFTAVKEDLIKMQHHATKMIDSTKSIDRLNDIFGKGAAKSFGTFSEEMLAHYLEDTIPGQFETQFQIPGTAEKIDFLISLADQKIGVDSKFPLDTYEAYRTSEGETKEANQKIFYQAVKTMVDDIAKKYVAAKFFDQVFIYFPSDTMWLEVANNQELAKYIQKKKVYPLGPSNILPIIALVAQHKQRVEVNENAESIILGMQKIDKHIDAFKDEFRKLGDKLRMAQDNYVSAERSLEGVHKQVNLLGASQPKLLE